MAGERYVQRAVVNLAAYIRSNIATYLRQVETDQGLATNSLEDPVEVLEADAEFDSRSTLMQVFAEDWDQDPSDYQYKLWTVSCVVAFSRSGDADLAGLTTAVDRYVTALVDCIDASSTLGDSTGVLTATIGKGERYTDRGDQSETRQVFLQRVSILTSEV